MVKLSMLSVGLLRKREWNGRLPDRELDKDQSCSLADWTGLVILRRSERSTFVAIDVLNGPKLYILPMPVRPKHTPQCVVQADLGKPTHARSFSIPSAAPDQQGVSGRKREQVSSKDYPRTESIIPQSNSGNDRRHDEWQQNECCHRV